MRRRKNHMTGMSALFSIGLALVGCNKGEAPAGAAHEQPAEPHAAEGAPGAQHDHAPAAAAPGGEVPAVPDGANVSFAAPMPGATIEGPLKDGKVEVSVKMATSGIQVKPAGVVEAGSGHHHVLIDKQPLPLGQVVPADEHHLHFGGGQTETTMGLTPGNHTLVLQFADGIHRSYGPALSATISVTVAAAAAH